MQVEVGREEAHANAGGCEFSLSITLSPFLPFALWSVLFSLSLCDKTVTGAVMTRNRDMRGHVPEPAHG